MKKLRELTQKEVFALPEDLRHVIDYAKSAGEALLNCHIYNDADLARLVLRIALSEAINLILLARDMANEKDTTELT